MKEEDEAVNMRFGYNIMEDFVLCTDEEVKKIKEESKNKPTEPTEEYSEEVERVTSQIIDQVDRFIEENYPNATEDEKFEIMADLYEKELDKAVDKIIENAK